MNMKKKTLSQTLTFWAQSLKYDWRQWVSSSFVAVSLVIGIVFGTICALNIDIDMGFFGNYSFFAVGVVGTALYHRARTAEAEAKAEKATRNEEATVAKANSRVSAKDETIQQLQNQVAVLAEENSNAQNLLHKAKGQIFSLQRRNAKLERDLSNANAFIEYLRNNASKATYSEDTAEAETPANITASASVEDNTPGIDDPDYALSVFNK